VSVYEYGTAAALARAYSVVHVHWPEVPLNRDGLTSALQARWFLTLIDALRRRGGKLVWTVHNLRSHEQRFPGREAEFFRKFVERVDAFITLGRSGEAAVRGRFPELGARPGFVIPHHHYRGAYADRVTRLEARRELGVADDARVLLFFGQILGYKNVPTLVRTVRQLDPARPVTLLVAGRPKTPADEAELRAAAAADPRIRLDLGFVAHERAQHYFRAADLVVLPYREILNSGAAVLALSFDRPVLLPELGACRELGEQIGGGWVTNYTELTAEGLELALESARGLPERTDGSHLAELDVSLAARRTLAVYQSLAGPGRSERGALPLDDRVDGGQHRDLDLESP
jgi:glycosyltransferase involved in cell wall biosynthesis